MTQPININDFTLEELEKLELITGLSFTEIGENFSRPKVIKTVLWINELRKNPEAKIEDFGKMTLGDASDLFIGENPKE